MAKVILVGEDTKNRIVRFNEENIEAKHLEMALKRVLENVELKEEKDEEVDASKVAEEEKAVAESLAAASIREEKAKKVVEEEEVPKRSTL